MFEPQQGKSFALNTGVREARGNVLAFTDDDVTVEPTWPQNLMASLNDGEWAGAGGRTLLAQSFPPSLFSHKDLDNVGVLAALFDRGSQPSELGIAPYGANMAYRKEMFEKYGLFRTDSPVRVVRSGMRTPNLVVGCWLLANGCVTNLQPSFIIRFRKKG